MMTTTAQRPSAQPPAAQPSRMTLANVVRGKRQTPLRVLLYGVPGVGKSTFAANAPSPIFLGAEDGTAHLDVERFPQCESWADVLAVPRTLETEEHNYHTLVVDTLDWAEPLLWTHVCERDKKTDIEAYGYGKGYIVALDQWRVFVAALESLRSKRAMNIVLLAHSWIKVTPNPSGPDYGRHELKLHARASGLLMEWCDHVLFAAHETLTTSDAKTKRIKGVSTGARLIYTTRNAAYDAKNHADLPESLPLSWDDFAAALTAHAPADPAALRSEIERKAKLMGGVLEQKALAWIGRAEGAADKLAKLNDWCNAKLGEAVQP